MTMLKTWWWDGEEKTIPGGLITLQGEHYVTPVGEPYYLIPKLKLDAVFKIAKEQSSAYNGENSWDELCDAINALKEG